MKDINLKIKDSALHRAAIVEIYDDSGNFIYNWKCATQKDIYNAIDHAMENNLINGNRSKYMNDPDPNFSLKDINFKKIDTEIIEADISFNDFLSIKEHERFTYSEFSGEVTHTKTGKGFTVENNRDSTFRVCGYIDEINGIIDSENIFHIQKAEESDANSIKTLDDFNSKYEINQSQSQNIEQ